MASGIEPALEIVMELVLELKQDYLRLDEPIFETAIISPVPIVFLELIVLLLGTAKLPMLGTLPLGMFSLIDTLASYSSTSSVVL